jgi:hypothetical protein
MKEPHKWSAECKDFLSKCLAKDIGARPDAATLLKVFTPPTAWPFQISTLLWLWPVLLETLIACGHPASVLEQGRSSRLPAAGPAQGSEAEGLSWSFCTPHASLTIDPSINTPGPSTPTSHKKSLQTLALITASLFPLPPPPSPLLVLPPLRLLANAACCVFYGQAPSRQQKSAERELAFAGSLPPASFELPRAFVAEGVVRANRKRRWTARHERAKRLAMRPLPSSVRPFGPGHSPFMICDFLFNQQNQICSFCD